ncbi:MAG: hypothetical protein COA88_02380 [Kordia sp.]|nr:MAG: hypothetical protein COA88_02380 [Kordia sp.]
MKYINFIQKFRWLVISFILVLFVVIVSGMQHLKVNTSLDKWFKEGDPLKQATEQFEDIFGNDQFVGILVETEDVFTAENLKLIEELGEEIKNGVPFVDEVYSIMENEITSLDAEGSITIRSLTQGNSLNNKTDMNALKERAFIDDNFYDRLLTKDCKQSMVAISFTPFPANWTDDKQQTPSVAAGELVSNIIKKNKYASLNLNATGLPVVNYQLLSVIGKETKIMTMISLLLSILITAFILRSFRGVMMTFVTAIMAILMMLGILSFAQVQIESTFLGMPILVGIAISICYSIHVLTFFKRHMRFDGNRREAVAKAFKDTYRSIIFTYLTTVAALLTFLFVEIEFVRFVGLSSALIVSLIFALVMVFMPAVLSVGKNASAKKVRQEETKMSKRFEDLSNWVMGNGKLVLTTFSIVFVIMIYGMTKVEVSTDWERTYGRKLEGINMALNVAESDLGALFSYEVLIELPNMDDAKSPENLKKLEALGKEILKFEDTKRINSIVDYVKNFNKILNNNDVAYDVIPDNRNEVAQLLYLYETAGGTEAEDWVDYEYKYFRLNVETDYYNTQVIKENIASIQEKAEASFPGSKVSIVGSLPQALKMQDYLVDGQIKTFALSLIIITMLLIIVFKSIKVGLIGLIPNISPAVFVGGVMGYMGIPLDMVTITLIPMLLGLAVDDTIHFINHCKHAFEETKNYNKAISNTFKTVGLALFFTTLILSVNFSVNTTSSVKMLCNMGIMSVVGIIAALLADYFVLPILLKNMKAFGEESEETDINSESATGIKEHNKLVEEKELEPELV